MILTYDGKATCLKSFGLIVNNTPIPKRNIMVLAIIGSIGVMAYNLPPIHGDGIAVNER